MVFIYLLNTYVILVYMAVCVPWFQGDSLPSVKHSNFIICTYILFHFIFLLFSVLLSFKYLPSTNMILFILSYIHTCSCAVHSIWIWRKKKYERVVLILCSLHMNCSFCLSFCCLNNADILFLYLHHSIHIFCFLSAYFFFALVCPCIGPFI